MNIFEPKTFSTDWEIPLVDSLERIVPMEKIRGFAGAIGRECDHPVHFDYNALEFGMGVNRS